MFITSRHDVLLSIALLATAVLLNGCGITSTSVANSTNRSSEACEIDTGGTCAAQACDESRHSECVNGKCVCKAGFCAREGKCVKNEESCAVSTGGTCRVEACAPSRNSECVNGECVCKDGFCADAGKCIAKEARMVHRGNMLFKMLDTNENGAVTAEQFAKVTGIVAAENSTNSTSTSTGGADLFNRLDTKGDGFFYAWELESYPGSVSKAFADVPGGSVSRDKLLAAATLLDEEMHFAKLFEALSLLIDRAMLVKTPDKQMAISAAPRRLTEAGFGKLPDSMLRLEDPDNKPQSIVNYAQMKMAEFKGFLNAYRSDNGSPAERRLMSCAKVLLEMAELADERTETIAVSTACITFIRGVKLIRAWEGLRAALRLRAETRILALLLSNLEYKLKSLSVTRLDADDAEILKRAKARLPGNQTDYVLQGGACVAEFNVTCLLGAWVIMGLWKNTRFSANIEEAGRTFGISSDGPQKFRASLEHPSHGAVAADLQMTKEGEKQWLVGVLLNTTESRVGKVAIYWASVEGSLLAGYKYDGDPEWAVYACFKTLAGGGIEDNAQADSNDAENISHGVGTTPAPSLTAGMLDDAANDSSPVTNSTNSSAGSGNGVENGGALVEGPSAGDRQ